MDKGKWEDSSYPGFALNKAPAKKCDLCGRRGCRILHCKNETCDFTTCEKFCLEGDPLSQDYVYNGCKCQVNRTEKELEPLREGHREYLTSIGRIPEGERKLRPRGDATAEASSLVDPSAMGAMTSQVSVAPHATSNTAPPTAHTLTDPSSMPSGPSLIAQSAVPTQTVAAPISIASGGNASNVTKGSTIKPTAGPSTASATQGGKAKDSKSKQTKQQIEDDRLMAETLKIREKSKDLVAKARKRDETSPAPRDEAYLAEDSELTDDADPASDQNSSEDERPPKRARVDTGNESAETTDSATAKTTAAATTEEAAGSEDSNATLNPYDPEIEGKVMPVTKPMPPLAGQAPRITESNELEDQKQILEAAGTLTALKGDGDDGATTGEASHPAESFESTATILDPIPPANWNPHVGSWRTDTTQDASVAVSETDSAAASIQESLAVANRYSAAEGDEDTEEEDQKDE